MLKIKFKSPLPIKIDLSSVFTDIGEASTALTDAIFLVKDPNDRNNNIINKTLIGSDIVQSGDSIDVQIDPIADFDTGKLEEGKRYKFFCGIKTTNLNVVYLPINTNDNVIQIERNGINV